MSENGNRVYGVRYEYDFYNIVSSSNPDAEMDFTNFFNEFKKASLEQDRKKLESLTQWSETEGGFFSINVASNNDFMKNVYAKLFDNNWTNAMSVALLDEPIQSQYGHILLSKVDPVLFGYKSDVTVYTLDNSGNALVFKKINQNFKLVALYRERRING